MLEELFQLTKQYSEVNSPIEKFGNVLLFLWNISFRQPVIFKRQRETKACDVRSMTRYTQKMAAAPVGPVFEQNKNK
jgi:hypothetical protein